MRKSERRELRSVHIIHIENQLAGDVTADRVAGFWALYTGQVVTVRPGDQVIVATGLRNAATVWFALPSTVQRRVHRTAADADRALLESVDLPHLAKRYDRLVIASGKHTFAPLARQAKALGMQVHQVGADSISSRLLRAECSTRSRIRSDFLAAA